MCPSLILQDIAIILPKEHNSPNSHSHMVPLHQLPRFAFKVFHNLATKYLSSFISDFCLISLLESSVPCNQPLKDLHNHEVKKLHTRTNII